MSTAHARRTPSPALDDQPDFIESLGPAFLAHLLRRVSDRLVEADEQWHERAGVPNPPRTSSTLLALERHGPMSITALAGLLRQSHQLVNLWIGALLRLGLIEARRDPADARRTLIGLSEAGRAQLPALRRTIEVAETATRELIDEVAPGLWDQLWKVERALRQRPFVDRIRQANEGRRTRSGG